MPPPRMVALFEGTCRKSFLIEFYGEVTVQSNRWTVTSGRKVGQDLIRTSEMAAMCCYHEVACGSSMLRSTPKKTGHYDGLCRHGCVKSETMHNLVGI